MKVLTFEKLIEKLNDEDYVLHIEDDIYDKIASEIERDSEGEEEYSGEVIVDIDDYFDIYLEYEVYRTYGIVYGGSDEYGNQEELSELQDSSLNVVGDAVYNKQTGTEYQSDFDQYKLEKLFEKYYGS